jgi:alkanesulfonate monooxygenase SsuD/methylene tetrahydromethanopterin reductase-like flavin-dependent oxidoreductase (luciferase family)
VGTDFDAIVRSVIQNVTIGETEKDVAEKLAWTRAHYAPRLPAEQYESFLKYWTQGLIGTPEQIIEQLTNAGRMGVGYVIARFIDAAYDQSSIDLFVNKVMPELAS